MKRSWKHAVLLILFALLFSGLRSGFSAALAAGNEVCRIDQTGYSALDSALSAVTEGKTIVLLQDIVYDRSIIAANSSYGIDLAGHRLEVSTGNVYVLAATGGKQLSIMNSGPAGSSLILNQTVADGDLAAASNFGAVFTGGKASRIYIAPAVSTLITSNMIGVDAGAENSIQIGRGTIRANRIGINVVGAGSVIFTGDVYGVGSGAYALGSYSGADIQVNGAIYSNGIGAFAQNGGHISLTDGITVYSGGSNGAYSSYGSLVQITGQVTAPLKGVFAEGGTISVDGSVTATGPASIGVFARNTISPVSQGTVTVTGSVSGARYGADAEEGANVIINGDAFSTAGSASYYSAAVNARYPGSMVMVGGKAAAQGRDSSGIEVYAGGTAEVDGNIEATGISSYGVRALTGTFGGTLYGSTATVNGTILATKYIQIGGLEKGINDYSSITINGYFSYTGAVPLCTVDVKMPLIQIPDKLEAPTGLCWDGEHPGRAAWNAVIDSAGYAVQLYKDGSVQGSAVVTGNTEYDFSTQIQAEGTGSYTFRVIACGNGKASADSDPSGQSGAYLYTKPEVKPGEKPAGVIILEELADGDEIHATDPALYFHGGTAGATPSDATGSDAYQLDYFEILGSSEASPADAIHAELFYPGVQKAVEAVKNLYTWIVTGIERIGSITHIFLEPGIQRTFTIHADAGEGGSISPEGETAVTEGSSQTFRIYPDSGYAVQDIFADGVRTGAADQYVFRTVLTDHTISVRFVRLSAADRGTGYSGNDDAPSFSIPRDTAGTWETDAGKWRFRLTDGTLVRSGWLRTGGRWYHFDPSGFAQTGWILDGGKWYHCDLLSCAMDTGLYADSQDGCSYYLNPDGSMKTGWVMLNGTWYLFNPTPEAVTYIWNPLTETWIWNGSSILPFGAMLKNAGTPDEGR